MGLSLSACGYGMFILLLVWVCNAQMQVFNILDFGAVPDGLADSSQALSKAWSQACESEEASKVLVPIGIFLVLPLLLEGPCNASVQLHIKGVLMAPAAPSYASGDHWLAIHQVNNLLVDGRGLLDGSGASAWPFNNCNKISNCPLPASLRLAFINNATIRDIRSINSKSFHMSVFKSEAITFDHVTLTAPGDSPNTDGIHISMSTDITVVDSIIGTGDDCISLGPGSQSINITGVHCSPGHGISIGSLGRNKNEADVTNITVQHSTFTDTLNGIRIKTWATPYPSFVRNITFFHLRMDSVKNPIIIDQSYCPHKACSRPNRANKSGSHVQIEGVRYEDIRGTSKTKAAVQFDCSPEAPCKDIELQDIKLAFIGLEAAISLCSNVKGSAFGEELPPPCF